MRLSVEVVGALANQLLLALDAMAFLVGIAGELEVGVVASQLLGGVAGALRLVGGAGVPGSQFLLVHLDLLTGLVRCIWHRPTLIHM